MLNRLKQRGGLPALAVGGLLTPAAAVSGGHFLTPQYGNFIGPYNPTPVWGSSLGALSLDPTTMAGRPDDVPSGTVLAPREGPRRLGLGLHPSTPGIQSGARGDHLPTLGPLPSGAGRPRPIARAGHPHTTSHTDYTSRCTHRLLVLLTGCHTKGTIKGEFFFHPALLGPPRRTWTDPVRPYLSPLSSWSIYSDASWRAVHPPQAQTIFGLQGTHSGRGALFLAADLPDWCSDIQAVHLVIPPTLRSPGGSAQGAELIAIQAGLHPLHVLHLRGTVYSDCLGAVKKITRRLSSGHSFLEAVAALVASCRSYLSDRILLQWTKGHPERSDNPQVSACPNCHRFWLQAHALFECPSTTDAREEGSLDLILAVNRPPPGPMRDLGRQFQTLLTIPNQPTLMARRWSGQRDQTAIRALQPQIARCSRKQIKAVLGHIGRVTSSTASACWRHFAAMAKDLYPPMDQFPPFMPMVARQLSTIDWDPRLGEDHG